MSFASSLANLRDAVVASLKAKIPGVPSIEPHLGAFREQDIAAFATRTPAIRVAMLGFQELQRNNYGLQVPVEFSAVIVTRDTKNTDGTANPRDVSAMLIANAVTLAVASNRFGLDGVFSPEKLRAQNQYHEAFIDAGLALWEVTWTSPVTLVPPGQPTDQVITALAQLYINGVEFIAPPSAGAAPAPVPGADPMTDAPNLPGYRP
ncbi:hypothetical protein [Methylocystis heyeri]|uniref:DUF1834 family protein n=1 Tax=Methylocystis heyeri TaxID=391905 RepID=A0A6B8KEM0_9HYPH|nr:hypothetical protein [Methylocystis heyeri]QGM46736.1 hypothetical protein H2LOC_014115 [Methylocystis heyeri]